MATPQPQSPSVDDLAHEENSTPEQIVASAVALYAALPPVVRASLLDALRTGGSTELANELARTAVIFEMRQRRAAMRERISRGEMEGLPDLTDEEMGDEAVRLVKESRHRRAVLRG